MGTAGSVCAPHRRWLPAGALAAILTAALSPFPVAEAQNSLTVGGATVAPGQAEVVVPISATTAGQLTGLDVSIGFDIELCKRIENQQIRMAGRTVGPPQEGVRCPDVGGLALVLFNLTGNPVLPAGDGPIAEWVFSVRADAASGIFPLDAMVNQARNGPLRVTLEVAGAGEIGIEGGPTVTPTSIVDTPTPTVEVPTDTPTLPVATSTSTATPTSGEVATVTATPTVGAIATDTPGPPVRCVGDCNGDGQLAINELIVGVNIALGNLPISTCAAFDCQGTGMVPINCLIQGVNNALTGCPVLVDFGSADAGPRS